MKEDKFLNFEAVTPRFQWSLVQYITTSVH